MTIVSVRRQGGAAVITIPSDVLKTLKIDIGAKLEVDVVDGILTARPKTKPTRRRYSLRELLRGATPAAIRRLNRQTEWAREGDSVGREI